MVEYYWAYHSTYRGIEIEVWMPGSLAYGAWIGGDWVARASLSALKSLIDDYLYEEEDYWAYHSTYRGIDIEVWMPGSIAYGAWMDDDWVVRAALSDLKALIDDWLGPVAEGWLFIEIYRELAIYLWQTRDEWYGYWTTDGVTNYGPYTTVQACRDKIDELIEPEPPVITSVTISTPSSAEKNTPFTVSGIVKDQYGVGVAGASVALYDLGSHFATVTTNGAGGYSKSTSISSTGVHELAAVSGGKYGYTDITITAPEEPEPPIISQITISAPSSHVEDSPFTVSGRVTDQYGAGVGGVTVAIYVSGAHFANDTPDSQGYYSLNLIISSPGGYALSAVAGTKSASRPITITEAPPAPSEITSISIDAPASADAGATFKIEGYVLDQYNIGISGIPVYLYDNGSHFATLTTNNSGYYSKSTSISLPGVHELAAGADPYTWAYRDITIIEIVVDVSTTLTVSAPASVEPNEAFMISGILYETVSGLPLPNQSISLSYNGVNLGSATTGVDGDYLKQVSIPSAGVYTLKAAFAGTTTLGASEATSKMSTGVSNLLPLLVIGSVAGGLVLAKRKKRK